MQVVAGLLASRTTMLSIVLSFLVKLRDEDVKDLSPSVKKFDWYRRLYPGSDFNLDETSLYWKQRLSRAYIWKEEIQAPGFKDKRPTVTQGANTSGDLKLKPANLQALKEIVKTSLGVYYMSSKRAWLTGWIITDLLGDVFVDDLKIHRKRKNLSFQNS